ncbi:phosphoribosylglycinamide formyltransferase [Kaistella jeonii]|uniref:Phosphoribosylglycinamide formyltransferase n=1 Tax=Kaistella jeonii TaxID=266749 RepID=A0A0C1CWT7_9FLAO|nr:phosphoribosylglycinamide formyltransferase [Kaistella jeonii]KIA88836.1 phosphoribosylglycinamide formyltransferase [Kaistella jeonii]SFC13546.1 phosphoribosylglycinamide formyltransferase-1 [Kaistella jeonii]VEI94450.1 Phosphoribosylglycinamide formyltransferase [Kaistella jeonii]
MKNIVVLVSGGGTNLQRIIDCIESGEILNAHISSVIADRECFGLERAKKHGIATQLIPRGKTFSSELKTVIPGDTDLIVLAGFLSILNKEFCESFQGKIINIHPALLPKFGGKGMWGNHVHDAVLEANENESGATVHYVTSGIDEGEIIVQRSFPIGENETVETLAQKIHDTEFEIYPKAINLVLNKN